MLKKHSPEILTGLGISGMVFTTVRAVMKTPQAIEIIEAKKKELGKIELTPLEIVQAVWKVYIECVIEGGVSIACILCATSESMRRNAALTAAYILSEKDLSDQKEKTVEVVGEEKAKEIEEAVAKEKVRRDPPENKEVVIVNNGETLYYESFSGRYFRSTANALEKAVNNLNRQMLLENCISLNDFYYEIGLDSTEMGDKNGWNINDGLIELVFTSPIECDGVHCIVVNYRNKPRPSYSW